MYAVFWYKPHSQAIIFRMIKAMYTQCWYNYLANLCLFSISFSHRNTNAIRSFFFCFILFIICSIPFQQSLLLRIHTHIYTQCKRILFCYSFVFVLFVSFVWAYNIASSFWGFVCGRKWFLKLEWLKVTTNIAYTTYFVFSFRCHHTPPHKRLTQSDDGNGDENVNMYCMYSVML